MMLLAMQAFVCGAQERSVSLQECLDLSRSSNPEVLNAALDVRAAKAQKQEAAANWFPTVSFSSIGFKAFDPLVRIGLEDVLGNSDAANNIRYYASTAAGLSGVSTEWSLLSKGFLASLNVSQPLFAGGRIANGNALAALGMKASGIRNEMALRDNDDEVVNKYWTIVSLEEKKKALLQAMELVRSLEKDVSSAVDAGLARESDLLQVRLKAREMDADMVRLNGGIRLAKMDLFNFIGLEYKVLELDAMHLSDDMEGLLAPENYFREMSALASSSEESRLLDLSVEAKKLEKKMVLGEGLPQVGVGASMGYGQVIGDPQPNALVYAMVKIPISDWGKTARKLQRSQYEIDKAENEKAYLDKQLLLKVNKDWVELQSAWEQKLAAEDAVTLAGKISEQKKAEYEAGLCTLSELLESQTGLQTALSARVDALTAYCNALSAWNKNLAPLAY